MNTTEYNLHDRFCHLPWTFAEIHADGSVYVCCPRYSSNKKIGNIFLDRPNEVWNSTAAIEFRKGILDGSFRMCDPIQCPMIAGKSLPLRNAITDPEMREIMNKTLTFHDRGPRHVKLVHDASCNLSCPSCRDRIIVAKKEKQKELDRALNDFILPFLADATVLELSGDGDPFASKHYRDILKGTALNLPKLKISLHTNGVLCNAKSWEDLKLEGRVQSVLVSIDAAKEETYDVVRRGGNWRHLNDCLHMLSDKRKSGSISYFHIAFVVQARNFREMADFVDLGKKYGADKVGFSLIYKWDRAMSDDKFSIEQVWSPKHHQYDEFRTLLKNPIFSDPIVFLGDVALLR